MVRISRANIKVTVAELFECHITVTPTKPVESIFFDIFKEIESRYPGQYEVADLEIACKPPGKEIDLLNSYKDRTLKETDFWPMHELNVILKKPTYNSDGPEDELYLGASASPTSADQGSNFNDDYQQFNQVTTADNDLLKNIDFATLRNTAVPLLPVEAPDEMSYVGLVNQAMTCYLNSLLQALYMTPEFRNALYNWEFDGYNESMSIPYQLQKLFLILQTSSKSAVETTDLTTSFGWQGSEAWHQHDIQELCRVMFDALEKKFKSTKQANLINDLYQGKMLDYVKCLDCGTEKSREDTFLDIPLPVRPFGNGVPYNSVEEALRGFVQPETLDGNNQYFCEKCNKKCDAHKGLKFTKFPYLLTLHLKRFDFDPTTMHRIKLNDKVVFPEKLNLNSFIVSHRNKSDYSSSGDGETVTKCDDCSTTDSGSADDESCQGTDLSSTVNGHEDNCADSDEGIDVSSGTNHLQDDEPNGPYIYELFSIMIHSGSASGGHYYAYIKDFEKNSWFCFNDQSVTPVTVEDIKKTYGGGTQRAYYSGAYSSSTNAYMLMYRQIDKERNCQAMRLGDFPPHLEQLYTKMVIADENDRLNRKRQDEMARLNVWCVDPNTGLLEEMKISTYSDSTLAEIASHAYNRFKLDGVVHLEDCRMVAYDKKNECICCSFESDEITYQDAVKANNYFADWMLEIRCKGVEWRTYQLGGINTWAYYIDIGSPDIHGPYHVRVERDETVGQLKQDLGAIYQFDPDTLQIAVMTITNQPKFLKDDSDTVFSETKGLAFRTYVSSALHPQDQDITKSNCEKMIKLINMYNFVIGLNVTLPETDDATLAAQSVPSLDCNQNNPVDKSEQLLESRSPSLRVSPQPGTGGMCGDGYDQSNSEDSSLSDSDRTLIGDAPPECVALSSSSISPDQHVSSTSTADPCLDTYNHDVLNWESSWDGPKENPQDYYFKVVTFGDYGIDRSTISRCRIMIDRRMTLESFKKNLELVLRVPSEYFKIFKQFNTEEEWTRLSDTLRSLKESDRINIKLGRVLKDDERQCSVYFLEPDSTEPSTLLFDHIISKDETVESAKRKILAEAKKHQIDIPYNRCRLREKNWKKPKTVYLDDQKFGQDINFSHNFELYLQELPEPETVTSSNQVVIFLRRFSPSELLLGNYEEVVLDLLTMEHLREKISNHSKIPLDNLDVAYVKGSFPYDMHILEVSDDALDWNPKVESLDQPPVTVTSGCMFFYKDRTEGVKSLTPEERREIRQREDTRLGRVNRPTVGRERALRIYVLDSPPSRMDDDID